MDALPRVAAEHPLTEQDLVKIQVLCAEGFLRLGRAAEATEHLRALQHAPVFKHWARTHLSASQPNDVFHVLRHLLSQRHPSGSPRPLYRQDRHRGRGTSQGRRCSPVGFSPE
jgi:hypothetical protein